jgi:HAMP domain-containing protein
MAGKALKCPCGAKFSLPEIPPTSPVPAAANRPAQPLAGQSTPKAPAEVGGVSSGQPGLGFGDDGSLLGALGEPLPPAIGGPAFVLQPAASGRRRPSNRTILVAGLAIGGVIAVAILVVVVVQAVRREAARQEVQKMMQSPEFREKVLGEKQGWQVHQNALGGYSVEMPGPPKGRPRTINSPTGPVAVEVVTADRGKDETFSVARLPQFSPVSAPTAEALLQGGIDTLVANMKARVVTRRSFQVEGFPAIEADYEGNDRGRTFSGRVWVIVTGSALYEVGWIVSPPKPLNDESKRFFASFKFTTPPFALMPEMPAPAIPAPPTFPTLPQRPPPTMPSAPGTSPPPPPASPK